MSELIFQLRREREGEGETVAAKKHSTLDLANQPQFPCSATDPPAPPLLPGYCVSCRSKRRSASRVSSLESSLEASRQIQNVINFVHIRNHFSITKTSPPPYLPPTATRSSDRAIRGLLTCQLTYGLL